MFCATQADPGGPRAEDSPGPGGEEGDAVVVKPGALAEREATFFAGCSENWQQSRKFVQMDTQENIRNICVVSPRASTPTSTELGHPDTRRSVYIQVHTGVTAEPVRIRTHPPPAVIL